MRPASRIEFDMPDLHEEFWRPRYERLSIEIKEKKEYFPLTLVHCQRQILISNLGWNFKLKKVINDFNYKKTNC